MSWLESPSDERRATPANAPTDPHRAFLRHRIFIELDDETQEVLVHRDATGAWIYAYPSREALAGNMPADAVNAAEKTGAQLRDWVRRHCPEAGVVFRQGLVEQVMVRPATPVQRVVIE